MSKVIYIASLRGLGAFAAFVAAILAINAAEVAGFGEYTILLLISIFSSIVSRGGLEPFIVNYGVGSVNRVRIVAFSALGIATSLVITTAIVGFDRNFLILVLVALMTLTQTLLYFTALELKRWGRQWVATLVEVTLVPILFVLFLVPPVLYEVSLTARNLLGLHLLSATTVALFAGYYMLRLTNTKAKNHLESAWKDVNLRVTLFELGEFFLVQGYILVFSLFLSDVDVGKLRFLQRIFIAITFLAYAYRGLFAERSGKLKPSILSFFLIGVIALLFLVFAVNNGSRFIDDELRYEFYVVMLFGAAQLMHSTSSLILYREMYQGNDFWPIKSVLIPSSIIMFALLIVEGFSFDPLSVIGLALVLAYVARIFSIRRSFI